LKLHPGAKRNEAEGWAMGADEPEYPQRDREFAYMFVCEKSEISRPRHTDTEGRDGQSTN